MNARAAALAALLVAGGCSSQWYPGYAHPTIARTDVIVRTEPSGAEIYMSHLEESGYGVASEVRKLPSPSPVRQPIDYDHVETQYQRQSNYGAKIREDMHPVLQVLTFPVWAVASFFHFREEKRRHEYGNNKFIVTAYMPGREQADKTIVLEGEAEHPVFLELPPEAE
jgi:hypothetical protein